MNIRRYTAKDIDGMMMHIEYHLTHSRLKRVTFSKNKMRDLLVGNERNSQFFCNLAFDDDDKIIGGFCASIMAYIFSHDAIAHDHFFYVEPSSRSISVATALVNSYIEWAKERKVKEVLLQNFAGGKMEGFALFAERLGFRAIGTIHTMEL